MCDSVNLIFNISVYLLVWDYFHFNLGVLFDDPGFPYNPIRNTESIIHKLNRHTVPINCVF